MTADEATRQYRGLSPSDQLRALARHAHSLTIVARDTYVAGSDDVADPRRLRILNEVQHRVVGFIASLADGGRPSCPDTDVVKRATDGEDPVLLDTFDRALLSLQSP